ncbi:MAG: hypothetical protein OEY77_01190 [Nitrospira sp.]|nr:hypothetical protein [Nitrospira sp.]
MWRLTLSFVAGSWLLVSTVFGADATPSLSDLENQAATDAAQVENAAVTAPNATIAEYSRYRMEEESNRLILAIAVMGTGLFALFLVLSYLKSIGAAPEAVVTGSGLVLVVFATVLIVILVKRDEQLTAATGILGAIAGYLFGKAAKNSSTPPDTKNINTTQ